MGSIFKRSNRKEPNFTNAIIALLAVVSFVALGMIVFGIQLQIMMLFAWLIVAFYAWYLGMTFGEIESQAYETVKKAIPTCMVLMSTGVLISSWIMSGTVSTLLFVGLKVCTPRFFLLVTFVLAAVVSVCTGTSWGTLGTVGIAMLGVSVGLGMPVGMTVGALVGGSFFGDKMSPVSDSTNLAAASAGTDVISHVKCMLYTTVPAFVISGIIYLVLGFKYGSGELDRTIIYEMLEAFSTSMKVSWITLIPAVIFLILLIRGISPILAILISSLAGFITAIGYQGADIGVVGQSLYTGVTYDFGNELINSLLHRGGMTSMLSTVAIAIIALGLGGLMQSSGILGIIVTSAAKRIKKVPQLVIGTMASSYLCNLIVGSNNFAMVMTGTLFAPLFKELQVKPQNLSRIMEDCGTMGCPLIPWNVNAVYVVDVLQVPWATYAPYCFLNFLTPVFTLIYGFTGFSIFKYSDEELALLNTKETVVS